MLKSARGKRSKELHNKKMGESIQRIVFYSPDRSNNVLAVPATTHIEGQVYGSGSQKVM